MGDCAGAARSTIGVSLTRVECTFPQQTLQVSKGRGAIAVCTLGRCSMAVSLAIRALLVMHMVCDAPAVPRHCTPREMLWLHAKFLFGHWMNDPTIALSVQRALVSMDLEAEADQPIEVMEKIYGPSFLRWVLIARAVLRGFDILMVRCMSWVLSVCNSSLLMFKYVVPLCFGTLPCSACTTLQLEEPLEGLDSVASMDLMKRIRRFARKTQAQRRGAIVAMTAHQPRQQVLDLVDDCFLVSALPHHAEQVAFERVDLARSGEFLRGFLDNPFLSNWVNWLAVASGHRAVLR